MPGQTRLPSHEPSRRSTHGGRDAPDASTRQENDPRRVDVGAAGAMDTPTLDMAGASGIGDPATWFWSELYDHTIGTLEGAEQTMIDIDTFIGNLGPTVENLLGQSESGRLFLAAVNWTDNGLQGHAKAKFGYADYGDHGGGHLDENDAVMGVDDEADVSFGHDNLPSFKGPGGFSKFESTDRWSEIFENIQGLSENIDKALELAAKYGLIGTPEVEHSQDPGAGNSTTTTNTTTDPVVTSTQADPNLVVEEQRDWGGLDPRSKNKSQFVVKGDGTIDGGPSNFVDPNATKDTKKADAKSSHATSTGHTTGAGPATNKGGSGPLQVDPKKLAGEAEWSPLEGGGDSYQTNLESYDAEGLTWHVVVFTYPSGGYDILARYYFGQDYGNTHYKLLKRCAMGAPLPAGLVVYGL